ncbi:MgtC/SapB family protein [Rhizorhabdus dicambivorans]|uniref:Protein MgtC n=1 Tax=Rhizorhabdus dicambivorans TaxID=1850238 RepID=A0A2A4FYQ7_9SPHN|nr:MgtC/SapB family protein [Rhizorhabdus dicambivorans]ATE67060.1 magnesium transporter [Rhizorhabdus dicambivorans]PCE43340.1 magnesium transporter [Rhizorhabdus dicambivorans]
MFLDLFLPMLGAVIAGALIGAEREYRASPAGFRTHILVSLSSALLMLGAVHQIHWLSDTPQDIVRIDPVRMAHGVLTGIGFLCGGVIFREGMTVRGLTTAASLWMTSALGILFGVGFYMLAIGATLATLIVLAAVHLSERAIPQRSFAELTVRYRRTIPQGRQRLADLIRTHGMRPHAISERVDGSVLELETMVGWSSDVSQAALTAALRDDAEVIGYAFITR